MSVELWRYEIALWRVGIGCGALFVLTFLLVFPVILLLELEPPRPVTLWIAMLASGFGYALLASVAVNFLLGIVQLLTGQRTSTVDDPIFADWRPW